MVRVDTCCLRSHWPEEYRASGTVRGASVPGLGGTCFRWAPPVSSTRAHSFLLAQSLLGRRTEEKEQLEEEEDDDQPVEYYSGHCEWPS